MISADIIFYALLGGIVPALIWLAFWLYEDYKNPEPRGLILETFALGMLAVALVLPLQKMVDAILPGMVLGAIVWWVILEEVFKFGAAYWGGLRSKEDNEPVDPLIYMITGALGFAAIENALFIFSPLLLGEGAMSNIISGNLRFIGASLLHVVSSGIVGAALAFSFYQSRWKKFFYFLVALVLAIAFHSIFNLAIIHLGSGGILLAFGLVWLGVILLLLAFEKAKTIAR